MNTKVDEYFRKVDKWCDELQQLRRIALDCMLTEELKWGIPVYMYQTHNVVGINGLKESCALAFFKGALLGDACGLLITPGVHTQAGRWIKFTSVSEITEQEPILKAYIYEAIEIERAGLKVKPKKTSDFRVPVEFQNRLYEMPELRAAFDALTPGRQRAYLLYFSAPKLPKTRHSRVQKYISHILQGRGLDD